MVKQGDTFKIGEICPESGVYRLRDCGCKKAENCKMVSEDQATIPLVKGKRFPPCRNCSDVDIVWEFVRKA